KKEIVPFSRVRKDVVVDPRLASNAFAGHEWGQKAHEDLIVTRGKGFTKEKNKKKRGSYRGGRIDTSAVGGIKFDD
ncbi:SRP40, C-terminal domain-containing protein, partial [Sordaria brevicollis]